MKRLPIVVAALLAASTAPALAAMSDQEFVTAASIGNQYEFAAGEFASTAAPDPRVKAFAKQIAADHADIDAELNVVARLEKLPVPYMMDETHDAMVRKLQSAQLESSAAESQRMFVTQQKEAHDKTVAMYEQYAREGTNIRLKDYALASLPTLRAHQKTINALAAMR